MKDMNEFNNFRYYEGIRNPLYSPSTTREDISIKVEYRVNYDKVISDFIDFFRSVSFIGFMQFNSMGIYPKRTLLGLLCEATVLLYATKGYIEPVKALLIDEVEKHKYETTKKGVMDNVNTIVLKLNKEKSLDEMIIFRQVCAYIEGEFAKALAIANFGKPVVIALFTEVLLDVTMMFNNAYIKR